MKKILKNSELLLIFFLVFLFKESIYGILIKTNNLDDINNSVQATLESYYEKEYNQLLNTINLEVDDNYNYQYSKILYRNVYEFYNEVTILKGKKHNIVQNSAVINEQGLIGTVKKVNKNSSVVTLITNPNSQVSIKVNNSYGILKYNNNSLTITSINNYESIRVGDIVYTSGLGTLPYGIKVGEVAKIITDDLGIEQHIIVKPYVDFDNINYVAVLNGEEL